jgi:hypothetical protein
VNGRAWSDLDLDRLRHLYPDLRAIDVAAQLGRSVSTVHAKANQLGIEKSEAFKAGDLSGRVSRGKQHPSMIATRFKQGHASWNKDTNFTAGGRSAETRFKPGRPASEARNYVAIGSHRINPDGYLERKVTDDPSIFPARRWVAVHRLVWIDEHGAVPDGHVVVFKPGRRTTVLDQITSDAVELVTRRELMRRNSYHTNYPPEVRALVQLKGAITRQVNRIAKESP